MTTLGQYMMWLKSQGGQCKSGIAADHDRGMVPVTKLVSPTGSHVIHPGNNQGEKLSTLTIEYFDRRLVLYSPFRSN